MNNPSLSVVIITKNEEASIERTLKSAVFADEIVVVDDHSRDATRVICRQYTDKIIEHKFIDFADQKNRALDYASGDWLLSLDADEVITPALQNEILTAIRSPRDLKAYRIPRRSWIFGREFRCSGTQTDAPIRLFRRGCARFEQPIHETVVVDGTIGRLKNPMTHFTYENITDYFQRLNRYTSLEAAYLQQKKHTLKWRDIGLKPAGIFLKQYFWQRGFRDGLPGFLFCAFSGFYVFLKYVKLAERNKTL